MLKRHQTYKVKTWWRNMDNRVINFLHRGEDNYMRFIHMDHKCRIDRVAPYPRVLRWKSH